MQIQNGTRSYILQGQALFRGVKKLRKKKKKRLNKKRKKEKKKKRKKTDILNMAY